jgi:hypothetical protein
MTKKKLAHVRIKVEKSTQVNLSETADRFEIHPDLNDRFVRLGLCEPLAWDEHGREWIFDQDIVPLVRRILRL